MGSAPVFCKLSFQSIDSPLPLIDPVHSAFDSDPTVKTYALQAGENGIAIIQSRSNFTVLQLEEALMKLVPVYAAQIPAKGSPFGEFYGPIPARGMRVGFGKCSDSGHDEREDVQAEVVCFGGFLSKTGNCSKSGICPLTGPWIGATAKPGDHASLKSGAKRKFFESRLACAREVTRLPSLWHL